jgi:CRP/FNR family transcriptional regulator, cyclic AMP receptor protein
MTSDAISTNEYLRLLLAQCHRRHYSPKAAIIRTGDRADELFYIVAGSVSVLLEDDKGHEIVLAYLNEGEFFGELGLFVEDGRGGPACLNNNPRFISGL